MKRTVAKTTILTVIILTLLFVQTFSPSKAQAESPVEENTFSEETFRNYASPDTTITPRSGTTVPTAVPRTSTTNPREKGLDWDNPNKRGGNPFKFKLSDSLNSNTLMTVVGCTGVVDKVSTAVTGFISKEVTELFKKKLDKTKEKIIEKACANIQKGVASGLSATMLDFLGFGTDAGGVLAEAALKKQCETDKVNDKDTQAAIEKLRKQNAASKKREECLNGIAVTLAKNQLTSMTKATMNWVNTGFNGNPMYVRDVNSFMGSIEDEILKSQLALFKNPGTSITDYPYGRGFAKMAINARSLKKDVMGGLKSDMTSYLVPGATPETFAKDFSQGGWNGWLAMTQIDRNNPFGFTIRATEDLVEKQAKQVQTTKEELTQGGGYLSQKKCVEYEKPATTPLPTTPTINIELTNKNISNCINNYYVQRDVEIDRCNKIQNLKMKDSCVVGVVQKYDPLVESCKIKSNITTSLSSTTTPTPTEAPKCLKWETVTPGSTIKDKVSTYVNSPERQLELARTINDSLNALFTALISKFQRQGLSSLSSNSGAFSEVSGGFGSNKIFSIAGDDITNSFSSGWTASSGGPFDVTKDIGNIYVNPTDGGGWNARDNNPELGPRFGIKNYVYTVTVAGNTSLFAGNNSWAVREKAFFDGTVWRKGVPKYVIDKRGVLQDQQDYIDQSQIALKIIPKVMPAIGELDYCIPGPNPSWQSNSELAYSGYTEYLNEIRTSVPKKRPINPRSSLLGVIGVVIELFRGYYVTIFVPNATTQVYRTYKATFINDSKLWDQVLVSNFFNPNKLFANPNPNYIFKRQKEMERAQEYVETVVRFWNDWLRDTSISYDNASKERYGEKSKMQTAKDGNTEYLEMAQTGLSITKNILAYDENIAEATTTYEDGIVQACSNIYKLNLLKNKINVIVKAAQARRAASRKADNLDSVSADCITMELGTYLVDGELTTKNCGNTNISGNPVTGYSDIPIDLSDIPQPTDPISPPAPPSDAEIEALESEFIIDIP